MASKITGKNKNADTCEVPKAGTSGGLITDKEGASAKKGDSRLLTFKIVAVIFTVCLIAMIVVICAVLMSRDSAYPVPGTEITTIAPSAAPKATLSPNAADEAHHQDEVTLSFISREDWAAQPPKKPLKKLRHPVRYVIISNTATHPCETQEKCAFRVRFNQIADVDKENLVDIRYNFLIGGDNLTYVGRGWDFVGAHSYGYNYESIGISFIGTFDDRPPPEHQQLVAKKLIEHGIKEGKISTGYKLIGYRQVSETRDPGNSLYNVIKTWPHWSRRL